MTKGDQRALVNCAMAEQKRRPDFVLPIEIDVGMVMALIGNIQLALRHPANTGASATSAKAIVAMFIQRLKEENFTCTAAIAELGDNPELDYDPRGAKPS